MENKSGRSTYVKINLDQIENNIKSILKAYPSYQYYIGVVKGNVYGHGSYTVNTMIESGINYLAVSSLKEALNIRSYQKSIPILCLEPIEISSISLAIENNITLTVSSLSYLEELSQKIDKSSLKIHLKINSGMNRLGFSSREEVDKAYHIISSKYVLEGIYTHFATLGISDPYWDKQLNRFKELTQNIDLQKIPMVHLGRSLTMIHHDKIPFCNAIRLGILMYGFTQVPKKDTSFKGKLKDFKAKLRIKKYHISSANLECKAYVKPAFFLYSKVMEIQNIKKGESTGYGVWYKANSDQKIAIAPIGYADGFLRKNTGRFVAINEKKYKIVGSVNMGMIQIEVDDSVKIGDFVEIMGDHILISSVSRYLGTTPYECMCMIHESIPRIYERNGKEIFIEEWGMDLEK